MPHHLKAQKINDRVYWVGAIDWGLRNFHGYATQRGSTYNAYLILADKITLIDTVKAPFMDEMMTRIASVIEPRKIDVIVSNHTEMDHSGALPQVIRAVQPETVYASVMGEKALAAHFDLGHPITAVKSGETVSLGNATLSFLETRMLHWPDSMFTYLAEDKLLFSSDAFGMHLATSERFADEIPKDVLVYEGKKYFANILLPYAPLITKLIAQVGELGIEIDTIAPDHGPIWRKDPMSIVKRYGEWAQQKPTRRAVITYDTMWQSTARMARAIEQGLTDANVSTKVLPLDATDRSDVVTEVLDAGALIVGSCTINNSIFPTVADIFCYLKGLKPKNLVGAAFGSYGWSGEAVSSINASLEEMKVTLVSEGIKCKYVPTEEALLQCRALGTDIAKALPAE